jgi:hypothetical protein
LPLRVNWRASPPASGKSQMSFTSRFSARLFWRTVTDAHLPSGETWTSSGRRV